MDVDLAVCVPIYRQIIQILLMEYLYVCMGAKSSVAARSTKHGPWEYQKADRDPRTAEGEALSHLVAIISLFEVVHVDADKPQLR